jgi:O-antigen/teichoic acid export membrane protein
MEIVGGEAAAPAADVLRIQALYLAAMFMNVTWQTALLALRMHRGMLISALMALVSVIVLLLVLIPPYEARGAAAAVVVSEAVLAGTAAAFLWRRHAHLRPSLGLLPRMLPAVAAAIGAAHLAGPHDIAQVAAATVAYFAVLGVLGAIPSELLRALLRRRAPEAS